jgi:hypothetical protein
MRNMGEMESSGFNPTSENALSWKSSVSILELIWLYVIQVEIKKAEPRDTRGSSGGMGRGHGGGWDGPGMGMHGVNF